MHRVRRFRLKIAAGLLGTGLASAVVAQPAPVIPIPEVKQEKKADPIPPPRPADAGSGSDSAGPPTILQPGEAPIDLGSALRLAGVENPELLLARTRVSEMIALRQLAAARLLPDLNLGTNLDLHTGVLQQSNGNILPVNRDALYFGLGANAIAAGTVNIPGLFYNMNVGEGWFGFLISRQRVTTARAAADAVRNDVLLRVCEAYLDLLRGDGRRAIAVKNRDLAVEIARLTAVYAEKGQGRKADADRAAVELRRRQAELTEAEAETLTASARLAQLLNLDPSVRLKPIDGWVVPAPLVPDPIPLPELLAIALMQRPELAARRSEVQTTLYELSMARWLPFSPNAIVGFSAGGFGGGSNLVASPQGFITGDGSRFTGPRFDAFNSRSDFDVVLFWTFRNLGVGNVALIRAADSRVRQMRLREIETLNLVRSQVAQAKARTDARFLQIDLAQKAVKASSDSYKEDLARITKGGPNLGLPLEVVDSLRLLARSRYEYLDAILGYNRAQFQLWVALGRPPANMLARPIPADLVPPPGPSVFPADKAMPLERMRSAAGAAALPVPRMLPAPLPVTP